MGSSSPQTGSRPQRASFWTARRAWLAGLGLSVAIIVIVMALPYDLQKSITREGGVIESLSALTYILCAVLLWRVRDILAVWPLAAILILMSMRELDMDKRLFTEGLFKSRQYFGDTVGLAERLISVALAITILFVLVISVRRYGRLLLTGLRHFGGIALSVLSAIILAAVSKSFDGLQRKLAPLGIDISDDASNMASVFEESAEMGICIMLVAAVLSAGRLGHAEPIPPYLARVLPNSKRTSLSDAGPPRR